jgi:protein KTI12
MALITITGFPSSGKSTRANEIKLFLEEKLQGLKNVLVISDDSLNIPRSAYNGIAFTESCFLLNEMSYGR